MATDMDKLNGLDATFKQRYWPSSANRSRRAKFCVHLHAHLFQQPGGQDATGTDDDGVVGEFEIFSVVVEHDMLRMNLFHAGFE